MPFCLGDTEKKRRMEKVMQNRSKKVKKEEPNNSSDMSHLDSLPNSPSFSQPNTPSSFSNPATPATPVGHTVIVPAPSPGSVASPLSPQTQQVVQTTLHPPPPVQATVTTQPATLPTVTAQQYPAASITVQQQPQQVATVTAVSSDCISSTSSIVTAAGAAGLPQGLTMGQTVGEVMSNAIQLSVAGVPGLPPNATPTSLPQTLPAGLSSLTSGLLSQQQQQQRSAPTPPAASNTITLPIIPGLAEAISTSTIAEAVQQAIQLQLMQQTQSMDISNLICLSRLIKPTDMYSPRTDEFLVRHLTQDENNMLNDLMQIYHLSFTADLEPLIHLKQIDPSLDQLVNQSSITVLRIIKFAKRLEEFGKLSQECQIGILKGCWIHILLLRSVSVYDIVRDVWGTPRGDIPTAILKNATGYDQLHDDHINYCKSIKTIIRDDITIVVILIVIVLFSPEGPHVMTRELVSNIQDRYLVLLKHYLESKYTYLRAADMFPQLISKMKELKELAEVHGRVLLDVNPNEIEPIMLEILDLK